MTHRPVYWEISEDGRDLCLMRKGKSQAEICRYGSESDTLFFGVTITGQECGIFPELLQACAFVVRQLGTDGPHSPPLPDEIQAEYGSALPVLPAFVDALQQPLIPPPASEDDHYAAGYAAGVRDAASWSVQAFGRLQARAERLAGEARELSDATKGELENAQHRWADVCNVRDVAQGEQLLARGRQEARRRRPQRPNKSVS